MSDFVEHKLLQGQGAGKWLPFARSKVRILHERALATGITALSQHWQLDGGDVDCTVRVVGDQRYIHIRRKSCPVFASGLADALLSPFLALPPLVPGTPLIETTVAGDPDHPQYAFHRFFPSARDANALDLPRDFFDDPRLARNTEAALQIASNQSGAFQSLKSGQFSGEMRKVVQVLQGLNEVVPYSPLYALTHGVFVAENGIRWVIEITVNGVVAWIMNVCTAQPVTAANGDVLLPYTPLPSPKPVTEDIPAAIAAGTFKVLAPAETVLDFYTKTPFYTHCGWAFSEDGHKAANVCFYYEGATARSSLYNIVITEAENVPTAATMTRLEDGYLFGTKNVHMKYPNPDGKLYSFDTRGPVPVVSNAPVYCWYEGDNLVVARHEFTPGTTIETVDDGNPGASPCASDLSRDLAQGTNTFISSPVLSIAGNTSPAQMHNFTGHVRRYDLAGVAGGNLANFSVGGGMQVSDKYEASIYVRNSANDQQGVRATLIVPFYDREAAYLAIELQRITASGSVSYQEQFARDGSSYFSTCLETCDALPDRCVTILSGAGGQADQPGSCTTGGGIRWAFGSSSSHYPGGEVGGQISASVQDGAGCAQIDQPLFLADPITTLNPVTEDVTTYSLSFAASGDVRDALPLPIAVVYLVAFIDEGETQRANAVRDAFKGDRYAISPNVVPEPVRYVVSDDAGYPVLDTIGPLNWIGVP